MELTIYLYGAGSPRFHAVPHVASVVPDGLVDDLQPHAVDVPLLPLRLALERDVLLGPVEDKVLQEDYYRFLSFVRLLVRNSTFLRMSIMS